MTSESTKSVLVTGSSSGIGNAVTLHLAQQGYTVLATVRKESDASTLNKLGLKNLKPIYPVDLTKPEEILSATQFIKEQADSNKIPPLYAIINIAGGGSITPIELMKIADFREELEKRIIAPVTLLQELIPLLRDTKGRILWIATPGLFPVPFVADIHAPDYAVNYLARTLNLELLPDGIKNTLIRCGGIKTPSVKRTKNELIEKFKNHSAGKFGIYKNRLLSLQKGFEAFDSKRTDSEEVAKIIAKVLRIKRPKTKYQVGHMAKLGAVLETLPQSWVDFIMKKRERNI